MGPPDRGGDSGRDRRLPQGGQYAQAENPIAHPLRTRDRVGRQRLTALSRWQPRSTANALGLTGHVGAIYVGADHTQQTKGQSKFHDALQTRPKQNLNNGTHNLTRFEDQFVEHSKDWYWLCETPVIASTLGMNELAFGSQPCP